MERRSLRDVAADADAARFVARDAELRVALDVLDAATPGRVLYVHGPGGIGKSALLRMIGRAARRAGFGVEVIDTAVSTRELDRRLDRLVGGRSDPQVVVVDEVDRLGAELPAVRDRLLDALDASSRLVVAGRRAPDAGWRVGGLDAIVVDVPLGPLSDEDATRLLAVHDVEPDRIPGLVTWAQGSPLALTVAGLTPGGRHDASVAETLEARLTTWLLGDPEFDVATEVLEVAALAPAVDARLLAAALPARSTRDAMARLTALPVVTTTGDRAVLHRVLAEAIRTRLAQHEPARYRTLSRRIVAHLGTRARLGDIGALVELSQFVTDPDLRQAISNRPSPSLFTDVPEPGELAGFAAVHGFAAGPDWDEVVRFDRDVAPYRLVVRRTDRSIVLYGAFARADTIGAGVDVDDGAGTGVGPVTASLHAAVTASGADPTRTFVGVVLFADVPDDVQADAARLGTGALMHLHGVPDMQAVFIHYPEPDRRPVEALAVLARELDDPLPRQVAISDFRPDGAVGFVEAAVLGELGFASRGAGHADLLVADDDPGRRARLEARLDDVFGDAPADRRLRRVIELVHLGPRRREEEYLEELHVSRRTWFRLLQQARERVADPDT